MNQNYYVTQSGSLQRKDNTLYFEKATEPETNPLEVGGKGEFKKLRRTPIPVEGVDSLYLFGEITLNTRLLNFLAQKQVAVHVFNYYGYYSGSYYPREYLNSGFLLVNQVGHYSRHHQRLNLARSFVAGAIFSMRRNLKYYSKPSQGKECQAQIDQIDQLVDKVVAAEDISQLMGMEGNLKQVYYSAFNQILELETPYRKREYRPPTNPINALISFGNSLVYTACLSQIYRTQLNPTISFLHEPGERRFSLSLDLAEIFKPLIADRLMFRLLARNQIRESEHFDTDLKGCYLTEEGRKIYIREFDAVLKQTVKHPKLKRSVSYQRLIRLECYKLIKHLTEIEPYQPLHPWW